MEACHLDCNPRNNRLTNLRWDTHRANVLDTIALGRAGNGGLPGERNPSAKLTEEQVAEVRRLLVSGEPQRVIAAQYGVSRGAITKINRGRTWSK